MWSTLPLDVLKTIFESFLTPEEDVGEVNTRKTRLWAANMLCKINFVLVCRAWWIAGVSLLYRHVCLHNYVQIIKFLDTLESSQKRSTDSGCDEPGYGQYVTTFAFAFRFPGDGYESDVRRVLSLCPTMRNLVCKLYGVRDDAITISEILEGVKLPALESLVLPNPRLSGSRHEDFVTIAPQLPWLTRTLTYLDLDMGAISRQERTCDEGSARVEFPNLVDLKCRFITLGGSAVRLHCQAVGGWCMPRLRDLRIRSIDDTPSPENVKEVLEPLVHAYGSRLKRFEFMGQWSRHTLSWALQTFPGAASFRFGQDYDKRSDSPDPIVPIHHPNLQTLSVRIEEVDPFEIVSKFAQGLPSLRTIGILGHRSFFRPLASDFGHWDKFGKEKGIDFVNYHDEPLQVADHQNQISDSEG